LDPLREREADPWKRLVSPWLLAVSSREHMSIQLEPKWVLLCLCSAGGEPPDVVLLRRIGLDHVEGDVDTWASGGG
jgi:hypothetical protein